MPNPPPVAEALSLLDEADRLLIASRYGSPESLNRTDGLALAARLDGTAQTLACSKATDSWEGLGELALAAAQTALVCGATAKERAHYESGIRIYCPMPPELAARYQRFKSSHRAGKRCRSTGSLNLHLSPRLLLEEDGLCMARRFTAVGSAYSTVYDFHLLLDELRTLWHLCSARRHPNPITRRLARPPACLHILVEHPLPPTPLEQQALTEAVRTATQARRIRIFRQGHCLQDWQATLRNSL